MADPLDQDRLLFGGTWKDKVGVLGGIAQYSDNYDFASNVDVYTGTSSAISNAIDAAASDTYVELDAGTYNISNSLTADLDHKILRGQVDANGEPTTIINFTGGSDSLIFFRGASWDLGSTGVGSFTRINVSSGATRGSTTVGLASTPTTLAVGQIMFISSTGPTGEGFFDLYQTDPFCQIVRVTGKSGNDVSFTPAINADYLSGTIRVGWRGVGNTISRGGIENIKFTRNGGLSSGLYYFKWEGTDECWLENVWTNSVPSQAYHVKLYGTFRSEIRRCDMQHMTDLTNSTYGIFADLSSSALIIHNHFHDMPNVMPMVGLGGSAFAYNYVHDLPYSPNTFLSQIVFQHGAHSHYNLLEGNWLPASYNDGTNNGFGSARNITFFRNRALGWDATGPKESNTKCICLMTGNEGVTYACSVLGKAGYTSLVNGTFTDNDDSDTVERIYSVKTTVTDFDKIGNWNPVDNAIPAGEAIPGGDAFVNSYLFDSKPTEFGILPWPPIGSDNPTQADDPENIPAGYRAINGEDPPPESSGAGTSIVGKVTISGKVTMT